MYQLEVKRWLVHHLYPCRKGWEVCVHVDGMERGKVGSAKRTRARIAERALKKLGASIGKHPELGPADVVAKHSKYGVVVVEVEGKSTVQKQQALYSALGQLAIQMDGKRRKYVIAFPDDPDWTRQAKKITKHTRAKLNLSCVLVSKTGVRRVSTKSATR